MPFGEDTLLRGTVTEDLRMPGQYWDPEKNSSQNGYRDNYYPNLGGYGQPDPIGQKGGINPFIYTKANPINEIDPSGLNPGAAALAPGWGVALAEPTPFGEIIMTAATVGVITWEWYNTRRNSREERDPYVLPPVNPGRDCNGKCKPCPEPPHPWERPGNRHGSTNGTHWHWIEYHQNPVTCECIPKRCSGPNRP